jgi:two-component system cell cycle response regulator
MGQKTILIADDMEDVRENISITLGEDNYNFLYAESGDEALKTVMSNKIDLVISDIAMPGGNGLELVKSMKKLSDPPKIILLTGYANMFPDDPEAKADSVIEKPYRPEDLKQIVEGLLI